jgi:hypothetical protein
MNDLNEKSYNITGIISKSFNLLTKSKTFNIIGETYKTFSIRIAALTVTLFYTLGDHDTKTLGEMDALTLGELDVYEV